MRHQHGDDADRQVDVEDPAPGVAVGDPAAEGRADRRADHHAEAEEAVGEPQLLGREGLDQDRLRGREHGAAAGALDEAEDHQLPEVGGVAAEERGDGEQDQRADEVVAAAEDAANQPVIGMTITLATT